jgi:hypothetical protein
VERGPFAGNPPQQNLVERINVAKSSGIEFNRVWRLKPLHYGTNIEPFIGFRFNQVTDFTGVNGAGVSPPAVNVIENNILGLQAGYRMSHKTGHWVLSNEFRFAGCQNWQFGRQGDSSAFVPVGDIRIEAAYELSREVALRVGWQMIYYGDGIRRGDPAITINDQIITENQDFLMHGVTFGIAVNR